MEIPAHLPAKQREMFLRIAQHTKKMKQEQQKQQQEQAGDSSGQSPPTAAAGTDGNTDSMKSELITFCFFVTCKVLVKKLHEI